jgi:ABC-2 type transport system permease protein
VLDSIFAKTVWERRRSIAWWVIGMVALAGLTVAFYPAIRNDAESFEELFRAFPPELLSIFGIDDPASLVTATGLVNSRLYSGFGPVILAVLGIVLGTGAIVGEEEAGTLNLLLAQPVSRAQIIVEKAAAAAVLVGIVAAALFLTLSVVNPLMDLGFRFSGILAANLLLWLFAMVFYTFTVAVGAISGSRSLTVGGAAGTTAALFFVNGLAPLVDEIAWMQKLTPFYWLQNPNPLANGFDLGAIAIFIIVSAVGTAAAIWAFDRRDIGT